MAPLPWYKVTESIRAYHYTGPDNRRGSEVFECIVCGPDTWISTSKKVFETSKERAQMVRDWKAKHNH